MRRIGQKTKIAKNIIPYFPKHNCYVELFFGGGGMFFNKPLSKYNFLNDLDNDVFDSFLEMVYNKENLIKYIEKVPNCLTTFNYFRKEFIPQNRLEKVVRFLYLSYFSFLGKQDMFMIRLFGNSKKLLMSEIEEMYNFIVKSEHTFINKDFRKVIDSIAFETLESRNENTFVYADPPYLDTRNNYTTPKWTQTDTNDLLELAKNSSIKFAISEFNHPFIIERAKELNLNIIDICNRKNLTKIEKSTEILITNYEQKNGLF